MSGRAVRRGFAFAGNAQRLSIIDARGHAHLECRRLGNETATATLLAWILDLLARAAAVRTRRLHHEEALRVDDLTFALTGLADFRLAAGCCARAAALRASDRARDLHVFARAPHGLGECQLEIDAKIGAARLALAARATTEEIAEQIAERGEDVFDVREPSAGTGPTTAATNAIEAVAIV